MFDLDLLVPSALVDPALAPDLLRDQSLPNLERLFARANGPAAFAMAPRASLTSWQAWVFARRPDGSVADVNLAELWAMACGLAPAPNAGRYVAEPAHFKVANDHLRLDDPAGLAITMAEARALATAAEPVLAEAGWRLDPVEPATLTHWMLSRDDGVALSAAAIERAIGDNVAAWQPRPPEAIVGRPADDADKLDGGGDAALSWRRCVNEIQMLWFGHPVNEAREERGLATVNTLWLSGNGRGAARIPSYRAVDSGIPLLAAIAIEPAAPSALESFDGFVDPVRRDDWSGWRDQLAALDLRIAGVLREQADGALGTVTLVLCGDDGAKTLRCAPGDGRKFWRAWGARTSLAEWFGEGALP